VAAADPDRERDLVALRELAGTFCAKELVPNQDRWIAEHRVDRELWHLAGDIGLLGLSVPTEYGGGGGTVAHEAVLIEEQADVGDTCWGVSAHEVVANYVLAHGTPDQRARWLPGLATGRLVGAIAITEPDAGSDVRAVATRAVRDGEDYRVTGSKSFVTNGSLADLVVMLVRTGEELSLLVVEAGDDGPVRGRPAHKLGRNGQDTAELFFDGLRVPAANVLGGAEGRGLAQLLPMISLERLLIAVAAVSTMDSVLAQAVRYTRQRVVYGRPLFRSQHVRFTLAGCATEAAVTRAFVERCVHRQAVGELGMTEAAMAKLSATERLGRVVDECLQLFGGYGYLDEFPIARAWADARITRIYGGANEVMKEIISGSL
jgi:acyl-CoA dehydrogenase